VVVSVLVLGVVGVNFESDGDLDVGGER